MSVEEKRARVSGIIVLVLSALILADGVYSWVMETPLFFEVDPPFKIVVGLIFIVLSAPLLVTLQENKK